MYVTKMELSEIQYFYRNRSVFLTGATGFVGKLVLEKILSTLYVKHVYVLVRDKNGVSAEDRCAQIFDSPAFEPLKRVDQDFYKRVTLIKGNCEEPDLGISILDKALLINEVECIFHCSSSSKLDDNLKTITCTNVRATRDLLNMAKCINDLKSFVFLSTAFSNFPKFEIHEEFYEPMITYDKLLLLIDGVDPHLLAKIESSILEDWPNTHTMTMNVAENMLKHEGKNMPVSIVRPSHILPSADFPVTGFVDNTKGLNGYAVAYAMGVNRVNYFSNGTLDVVPVDYVVNMMVVSGWYAGLQKLRLKRGDLTSSDVHIYHCISSQEKPLTSVEYFGMVETAFKEVPSNRMIQLPTTFNTACYYNYKFLTLILHYFMAFLCDTGLKIAGKQPMIITMYNNLHRDQELLNPYLQKQWYFSNDNAQKILKRMSFRDRELFNFDILNLNWQNYFISLAKGVRVYLLKDPMSTLAEAKKRQRRKLCIQLISAALLVIVLYIICKFLLFRVILS